MKAAFFLFIGAFIVATCFVAPFLQYKDIQEKMENSNPPKQSIAAKPLPEKTIPEPKVPIGAPTQQIVTVEAQKQFETNTLNVKNDSDIESVVDQAKLQKQADIAANEQRDNLSVQEMWDNNLPFFRHSLEYLYDILNLEAAKRGDGIEKKSGYFNCLPQKINFKMDETEVSEIRFQKETNLDFKVSITKGGQNPLQPNGMKIVYACGYLEFEPFWVISGSHFHIIIQIPGYNDDKTTENMTNDQRRELVEMRVKILVGAQIRYLSSTNR